MWKNNRWLFRFIKGFSSKNSAEQIAFLSETLAKADIGFINGTYSERISEVYNDKSNLKYLSSFSPAKTGQKFYHYYSLNPQTVSENSFPLNCVINDRISLSKPSSFDDPYDSHIIVNEERVRHVVFPAMLSHLGFPVEGEITDLSIQKTLHTALESPNFIPSNGTEIEKKFYSSMLIDYNFAKQAHQPFGLFYDKQAKYLLKNIKIAEGCVGICCFSTDCFNQRMWSEYAGSHKGICVEYSIQDKKDAEQILPVIYVPQKPGLSDDFLYTNAISYLRCPEYLMGEMVLKTMRTKNLFWMDQNEWRIIRVLEDPQERLESHSIIPFGKVTRVYLGACMSAYAKEYVIAVCGKKGIPWNEMQLQEEKYLVSPIQETPMHISQRSESLVREALETVLKRLEPTTKHHIQSAFLIEDAPLIVRNGKAYVINLTVSPKILGDLSRIQGLMSEIDRLIKE